MSLLEPQQRIQHHRNDFANAEARHCFGISSATSSCCDRGGIPAFAHSSEGAYQEEEEKEEGEEVPERQQLLEQDKEEDGEARERQLGPSPAAGSHDHFSAASEKGNETLHQSCNKVSSGGSSNTV